MLLYVESKAFPFRNFVVRIQPHETIARVRAHLLHVLHDIGQEDHQFRLRFKGEYLRDAYSIQDYGIVENAIIKMVPFSRRSESFSDLRSLMSTGSDLGPGTTPCVKAALKREIKHFRFRERLVKEFRTLLNILMVGIPLALVEGIWYMLLWAPAAYSLVMWLLGLWYRPVYSRLGGYIGQNSIYKNQFCVVWGVLSLVCFAVDVYLAVVEWTGIANHGCPGSRLEGDCSFEHVFAALFFTIQAVIYLLSFILVWILLWNMKLETGDLVEKYLVQTRDIEEVMKAAKKGRVKEKRIAAFELATLASTNDDNKFRIVAEGGLDVLISMALCHDEPTQEHAVEAIAELLTIPSIQDTFVDMGGVRTLSVLLHSNDPRLVYEAAVALSYIVSDSEENKAAIVNDHGLEDLCFAAERSTISCQRIIAGIFLELAFQPELRSQMAAQNSPAKALLALCQSNDPETMRYALQTLELLAIESSDMIWAQEDLLILLLDLPKLTMDLRIYLLAGKILLYYAENRQTCEAMLDFPGIKDSLSQYAHSKDPTLQKVVVKVIFSMIEYKELKYRAVHIGLDKVLKRIREEAADRETWDMADQALQMMLSEDELMRLPHLSTVEKLSRMDSQSQKGMGSRGSLASTASIRSSVSSGSVAKAAVKASLT